MGNCQTINDQIKAKCLNQFVMELQEEGSLVKCDSWRSMSKVLNRVHRQIIYKDAIGNTIRIPGNVKNEFINIVANRYRLVNSTGLSIHPTVTIKLVPEFT